MKLYCFQCDNISGDYVTENGIALAKNEEQAWKLFLSKYNGYWGNSLKELKENYKIVKSFSLNKPLTWHGGQFI